jgi:F-type H+-transporting ATPase subunit gamma
MASLKSIKKRIVSVKSTRQITKAMKMVAAAKLRRAQENVVAARPYASKLREVMERLAQSQESDPHPLMARRDTSPRALILLVTSDRGLCGGFNANISKAAERFIQEHRDDYSEITLATVGRKGYDFLKNRQKIVKNYSGVISKPTYQSAALIAQEVVQGFMDEEYDDVFLFFNAFRSVMSQDITCEQLLPITPPVSKEETESGVQYIYEPTKGELLGELLPKSIEVAIFKAMLESVASEHGARMTAMDSASKNATEMIGKLTLIYNRARQAAITTELTEIISGAESIKG